MSNITETLLNAYQFRHACKAFNPEKKIPEQDLTTILETARLSPSSFGLELWQFVVVGNSEFKEKIFSVCPQVQITSSSHIVVTLYRRGADIQPHSEHIKTFMKEQKHMPDEVIEYLNNFFQGFVDNLFELTPSQLDDWSARQTYIALGNMMTTASLLGIDSCPLEGFNKKALEAIVCEKLNLNTEQFGVANILALGYRAEEPNRPKTRRDFADVVTII